MASTASGGNDASDKDAKWNGSTSKLDDFDKSMGRWVRKQYGTKIGMWIWLDEVPDIDALHGNDYDDYCETVWDSINDRDSTKAKYLYPTTSGFYNKEWQKKWISKQYDRLYDRVEGQCTDSALLEVEALGMDNAKGLRAHLVKQFGGAGDDVRAREEHYQDGMPAAKGHAAFPPNVDMEGKLRQLSAERNALWKMCKSSLRKEYEWGKESALVKICLKHLRGTDYQPDVDRLLQEIKLKKNFEARLPVKAADGSISMPTVDEQKITDDWDFRNYSDDWLPSWNDLKTKLISVYKSKQFAAGSNQKGGPLPVMFVPGAGTFPKVICFGCGERGHRRGDPECKAGPNDWADCTPTRFKQKFGGGGGGTRTNSQGGGGRFGNGASSGKRGQDGMSVTKSDGICFEYRDTGKCKFGEKCRFKHVRSEKKVKLTKAQKKGVMVAAVKKVKASMLAKAAKNGDSDITVDGNDLESYLASLMQIRTYPRIKQGVEVIDISSMATSALLDMERNACYDSGSATGITTDVRDMAYIDTSVEAQDSVTIRGPSVGAPKCEGRGPVVFRVQEPKNHGVVHPDGVLASVEGGGCDFRVASERIMNKRGLRFIGGEFSVGCKLECVRSKQVVPMDTKEDILVLETDGTAADLIDSPALRTMVDEVRNGVRSPLVDLSPFLKGGSSNGGKEGGNYERQFSTMSKKSLLAKFLFFTTVCMAMSATTMIFNEAKVEPEERSRVWVRRLAYTNSQLFWRMHSMPEYGDFPDLPALNEDNVVGDLAKAVRNPYPKNDPAVTMACPPFWRIYLDGYGGGKGGKDSMGKESYEGAVGGYLFCCVSTGTIDCRLYASHEQFPVALHQFLCRVEAEHYKCAVIYVDTFSVNLSADAEEVCALFGCVICPVSAGTPQEMAFAESAVKNVRRMSTAMLEGAPHLGKDCWALCDKYACYLNDFLPKATRKFHCPFYLRTGKMVPWKLLSIHVMGAPLCYAPMEGAIHKRSAINKEGHFVGIQWPAALVQRKSDKKILNVSRQKIRVYESAYMAKLDQRVDVKDEAKPVFGEVDEKFVKAEDGGSATRPELSNNRVQSIKSLREHKFLLPGRSGRATSSIEESAAMASSGEFGGEGLYVDPICNQSEFSRLTELIQNAKVAAESGLTKPNIRQSVLAKLDKLTSIVEGETVEKGQLKIGKRKKDGNVSRDNVVVGKRKRVKATTPTAPPTRNVRKHSTDGCTKRKAKGKGTKIKKGDLVSAESILFDGDVPGSFSKSHPDRCFGRVGSVDKSGLVHVQWLDGDEEEGDPVPVRLRDLQKAVPTVTAAQIKVEVRKMDSDSILVFLMEGEKIAFDVKDGKDKWPKNFFEVLVRADWRKWVEAVKKELTGWDNNNAVTVVPISEVPRSAKVVPLGELYTIKRCGKYKFRQYLMGNLLREGKDFGDTFSTTISHSGICIFYSLATTCGKEVWGWDAVCGYLQCKEQYDIYAFLPSHHEYSSLEYEQLGKLRQEFIKLLEKEGEEGIRKFAARHKKDSRTNPDKVLRANSSIYGGPGCGHEWEMLVHGLHTKDCGCMQTAPEPSMFVRIVVDDEDVVVGYLIAMAWTDDLRMFGTAPELKKYMEQVSNKIKVTFEKPPVLEFVSIETYQDIKRGITELKMPKYWQKAYGGLKSLFKDGAKARVIPISVYDERILSEEATEDEIAKAKHLPFNQMLGIMSYGASSCKFEMKFAVSRLGSRRNGWSMKQFEVMLRTFEYGLHTCEIGLMFSKGLDPHGEKCCVCMC